MTETFNYQFADLIAVTEATNASEQVATRVDTRRSNPVRLVDALVAGDVETARSLAKAVTRVTHATVGRSDIAENIETFAATAQKALTVPHRLRLLALTGKIRGLFSMNEAAEVFAANSMNLPVFASIAYSDNADVAVDELQEFADAVRNAGRHAFQRTRFAVTRDDNPLIDVAVNMQGVTLIQPVGNSNFIASVIDRFEMNAANFHKVGWLVRDLYKHSSIDPRVARYVAALLDTRVSNTDRSSLLGSMELNGEQLKNLFQAIAPSKKYRSLVAEHLVERPAWFNRVYLAGDDHDRNLLVKALDTRERGSLDGLCTSVLAHVVATTDKPSNFTYCVNERQIGEGINVPLLCDRNIELFASQLMVAMWVAQAPAYLVDRMEMKAVDDAKLAVATMALWLNALKASDTMKVLSTVRERAQAKGTPVAESIAALVVDAANKIGDPELVEDFIADATTNNELSFSAVVNEHVK